MRVLVIGAGVGGLSTALSLHAAGIDVVVYETVPDIQPLGVGINLQPNAVRELVELGLGEALSAVAIPTSTLSYYNKHGQLIWSEPRGLGAGYKWPQYSIHRGHLQTLLLDAVRERLGDDAVRTGHRLIGFDQDARQVRASFIDTVSGEPLPEVAADALIGADGVHSTVRRQLFPNEGTPVSSGRIMWRGTTIAEPYLDGRTQVMIGHREQRSVIYPMSGELAAQGKSMVNWLCILGGQGFEHERESYNKRVPKERFFEPFANWVFDWIDVAGLISATEDIFEYPKADRDPLPRWSFDRVTLLGDAAHPMRPIGSQAGSQAVVDARFLAKALAESLTVEEGLKTYETLRLPAVNAVVLRNRDYGPEIVMQMAEDRAPQGFERIDDVIPQAELEAIALSFKKAAGFDPEGLNARPSLSVVGARG